MSQCKSDPQWSEAESKSAGSGGRRSVIAATLLILMMIVLYYPTSLEFYAVWTGMLTYVHGFIVAPMAIGFIILGAQYLDFDWRRQSPWLIIISGCTGLVWTVAYISATQVMQQLAFIGLLYLGLAGLYGRRGMRSFLL